MSSLGYRAIAVIPARGGSKRLPRKNLIELGGKPLLAHTIEAAFDSGCFEKVLVSSEDQEILDIAENFGATPYLRADDLAGDSVATAPVLIDVLDHEKRIPQRWDILACLYATAPLRQAEDIKAVVNLIVPGTCDFAMAVSASDRPIHQALAVDEHGILKPVWPDAISKNSQDAPIYLFGNGSTYAVNVPAFLEHKTLYGPGLRGHMMPRCRSVDIDTEDDLALVRYYAEITP
ncbi:MAG: acylneuraminate cytidylyltransferase family protein [Rhodospirillaceae bacterium]